MERNFTNENFEGFLKQNADRFRMRPTDKVWSNISSSLKKDRRNTAGLSGLFLLVSLFSYLATNQIKKPTDGLINRIDAPAYSFNVAAPVETPHAQHLLRAKTTEVNRAGAAPVAAFPSSGMLAFLQTGTITSPISFFESSAVDSDPEAEQPQPAQSEPTQPEAAPGKEELLSVESVVNSYKAAKRKKLGFQFYFSPTVSYRKLSENKSYLRSVGNNIPSNYPALYTNVNNLVTHKPDMGFEMGLAGKYELGSRMKVRAGLQFNVNRYDIRAFKSITEMATITLNSSSNRPPDSVMARSNYNNFNGYQTNWLQNFYIQVSSPVGVEYTVTGNKNIQFGIASTIQPTYLLGDRAYMITSDYKNYVEVPWLVRRWNVNTNLETFVAYSTGKMNWQVGPQVRYQLLSSFISKYPVKENLFDFGLKVGISLNQ